MQSTTGRPRFLTRPEGDEPTRLSILTTLPGF